MTHNIPEIIRRTGLSREAICRMRAAKIIQSVDVSPLGRPLFPSNTYARIERAEQLRELGMTIAEIQQTIESDDATDSTRSHQLSSISNA